MNNGQNGKESSDLEGPGTKSRLNSQANHNPLGIALNLLATGIVLALAVTGAKIALQFWNQSAPADLFTDQNQTGIVDSGELRDWVEIRTGAASIYRRRFQGTPREVTSSLAAKMIEVAQDTAKDSNGDFDSAGLSMRDRLWLIRLAELKPILTKPGLCHVYSVSGPVPLLLAVEPKAIAWASKQVNHSEQRSLASDEPLEFQPNDSVDSTWVLCWALALFTNESNQPGHQGNNGKANPSGDANAKNSPQTTPSSFEQAVDSNDRTVTVDPVDFVGAGDTIGSRSKADTDGTSVSNVEAQSEPKFLRPDDPDQQNVDGEEREAGDNTRGWTLFVFEPVELALADDKLTIRSQTLLPDGNEIPFVKGTKIGLALNLPNSKTKSKTISNQSQEQAVIQFWSPGNLRATQQHMVSEFEQLGWSIEIQTDITQGVVITATRRANNRVQVLLLRGKDDGVAGTVIVN